MRFSNSETEQILSLIDNHMRFGDVQRMKESTFKKFVRMPRFDEHLELHRLDVLSSFRDLSLYNYTREKAAAMPEEIKRPQPLISGEDLIAEGYRPGPKFKEILGSVEDGQLEGRLQSKTSALEFVRQEFPK
jgi:poly(A) polymerase